MKKQSRSLQDLLESLQNVGSVSLEHPTQRQLNLADWGKVTLRSRGEQEITFFFRIDRETSVAGALRANDRGLHEVFLNTCVNAATFQEWINSGKKTVLEFAYNPQGQKAPDTVILLRKVKRLIRPGLYSAYA